MINGKLSESFKVKILSVLVAFGMWIFVMEKIDPIRVETLENVPISEITNIDNVYENDLAISQDQKLVVNIDFRGKRSSLLNFLRSEPVVKATIQNPVSGENRVELTVTVPTDIEYSIEPSNFYITLEESVVSTRKIEITYTGTPEEEYSVNDLVAAEQEAVVEGAKSQVDKVSKLLGTVNVDGAKKNYTLSVKVIPVDSKGIEVPGVSIKGEYVSVEVKIEQSKVVPIGIRFVDENGEEVANDSYTTDIQSVTITGEPSKLQNITEISTVDISVDDFNQYIDRGFDLEKIDGVKMSVGRVNLQAQADLEQEYVFTIPAEDIHITYTNNADQIRQSLPEQVEIRFSASKSYESTLTEENVKLFVDNKEFADSYGIKYQVGYPVSNVEVTPNIIKINQGE